jgi:hypothetical protein
MMRRAFLLWIVFALSCGPHDFVPGSRVRVDVPKGFRAHREGDSLELRSGKLIVVLEPVDKTSAKVLLAQSAQWSQPDPKCDLTRAVTTVHFGPVSGTKFSFHQMKPAAYKRVEYILQVPGGHIHVVMDASGNDFDEVPIESQLHTLQILPPKPPTKLTPAPKPAKTQA